MCESVLLWNAHNMSICLWACVCVCGKCARVLSVSESEIVYVMCVCVRWCDSAGVRVCFVVCR